MNKQEVTELIEGMETITNVDNITLDMCRRNAETEQDAKLVNAATCCISVAINNNMMIDDIGSDYIYDIFDGFSIDDDFSYTDFDTLEQVTKYFIAEDLAIHFDYKLLENSLMDSLRVSRIINDGFLVDPEFNCHISGQDAIVGEMLDVISQTVESGLKVNAINVKKLFDSNCYFITDDFIDLVFKDYDVKNLAFYVNKATGSVDIYNGWNYVDESGNTVNAAEKKEVQEVIYKDETWITI